MSKMPPPSVPKEFTDDEIFGQLISRKLSKIPEGEDKENIKLEMQLLINRTMFRRNYNTLTTSFN